MTLLDQHGNPTTPENSAPSDFADWPHERRQALYEMAGNWATMTRVSKWVTTCVMFFGALAAAIYYIISGYHEIHPSTKG